MHEKVYEQWLKMDELSNQKVPFFFMVDFLKENVEIYTEIETSEMGLLFDFQNDTSVDLKYANKPLKWETFPESKEDYQKGFDIVQKNINLGTSYLVNYTKKTPIKTNLSLEEIYKLTRAKYKVCIPNRFVFFSPETFIEIIDNKIYTHPMKGTIDASIENAAEVLKNDIKEKAEHYTVVDLLRNDLSMVADNVNVDDFQRIDLLKTKQKDLLTMSSEISGTIKPEYQNNIGKILNTLLPAGSILGAPKPKTLEIILEAESQPRGFYSGVCGWFDGKNLDSCVMIRFIEKEGKDLFFRSGGGITHRSNLDSEYQEMKNKIYVPIY